MTIGVAVVTLTGLTHLFLGPELLLTIGARASESCPQWMVLRQSLLFAPPTEIVDDSLLKIWAVGKEVVLINCSEAHVDMKSAGAVYDIRVVAGDHSTNRSPYHGTHWEFPDVLNRV